VKGGDFCWPPAGTKNWPLTAHPLVKRVLFDGEFRGDRSHASASVDDAVRCLSSEFQRELPSGDCHGDIFSSDRLSRIVGCLLWLGNLTAHLSSTPTNGTIVKGVPSDTYFISESGERTATTDTSGAITVEDSSLTRFPLPTTATSSGSTSSTGDSPLGDSSLPAQLKRSSMTVHTSPASIALNHRLTLSVLGLLKSATGSVAFSTGSNVICRARVAEGAASCTTPKMSSLGRHQVLAKYSGDSNYRATTASTQFNVS
jgi:hypothetical protein